MVFLDTNVVLDYLLGRSGFYEDAEKIFESAYSTGMDLCISSLSVANIAYVARKAFSQEYLYDILSELKNVLYVSSVDDGIIDKALELRANDFEDAIQYFSARQAGVDCIVTRNAKDFDFSEIEVRTPSDFLSVYFASDTQNAD